MKNLGSTKMLCLLLLSAFLILGYSCQQEDEIELEENSLIEQEIQFSEDAGSETPVSESKSRISSKTRCDIYYNGRNVSRQNIVVSPGARITLEYRWIDSNSAAWDVDFGNITLLSRSGRRATFRVNSSGRIFGSARNGKLHCSEYVNLRVGSDSCPTSLVIQYAAGRDGCDDFLIDLIGGKGVKTVKWYYSVKHVNNKLFYTGNYRPGDRISAPLYGVNYLNGSTIDLNNHYLWVKAEVTLSNGRKCYLRNKILLSCFEGGGSNY